MNTIFGRKLGSGSEKVVAMNRFSSGRSLSPLRQAEAYWTALLTGSGVPARSQIDPRGLENIVEYTFVLERIAPGLARFRLAGSHLNTIAGMEVRGMPFTAFFENDARKPASSILEQVFERPAIAELELQSAGKLGRGRLEARMILLPLRSDLGDVSRILGVMVSDDAIGAKPRRFSINTCGIRNIPQMPNQVQEAPAREPAFAEDQRQFEGPAEHLRLVVSRDS